jgi:hypothetical protein
MVERPFVDAETSVRERPSGQNRSGGAVFGRGNCKTARILTVALGLSRLVQRHVTARKFLSSLKISRRTERPLSSRVLAVKLGRSRPLADEGGIEPAGMDLEVGSRFSSARSIPAEWTYRYAGTSPR